MSAVNAALVVIVGLGWGLLAPANKVMFAAEPSTMNGTTLAVARAIWALPFFAVAAAIAWRVAPPRLTRAQWLALAGAGIVFGPAVTVLFSVAAQHTSVAHISFLVGVAPVTNTAAAALVFRSPLERRGRIALALGVAGVVLLAATQGDERAGLLGDAIMLVWLASFAIYACCLRAVGPNVNATLLMSLVGVIALALVALPGIALGAGGAAGHVADAAPTAWWFFGEIVLGSMLLAQTAYAAAVKRIGIALATIGSEYLALGVGVAASLAMHERWNAGTVVAGLLFCAALAATFVPQSGGRVASPGSS